jgi:hypothetical protein
MLAFVPLSFAAPAEARAVGICDSATLSSMSRTYIETIEAGNLLHILGSIISKVGNAPWTIAPYTQDGVDRPVSGYRALWNQGAREILESNKTINLDECFTDIHIIATNGDTGKIDIQTQIGHSPTNLTVSYIDTTITNI